ncbi:recombinase family protein [Phocaeicola massiliensis]|uniref:recombinase family protein n=1 Tax=Phocaeicola massiliensis TaxID=204516 RepID=UPI0032C178B6
MEKKVIALIRTSTIQQEIDSQREEVLSLILADGYSMDEIEVVGEKGASAIKMDEAYLKNINRVYDLIEQEPIKAVYAWAIDRIGRDVELLQSFRKKLVNSGVDLVIRTPSLRLLNPDGSANGAVGLAFSLFAEMAQQEMEQKKARFMRAKKRNSEAGKANGGAKNIPFGYSKDANGYFIINEEEANVVRLIFELHNSGKYSLNKLALELNERGYSHRGKKFTNYFLRMFIKSTVVIGYSDIYKPKTGWKVKRIYPQIISKEIWEKAQTVLLSNQTSTYKGTKHYYLGAKLLKCSSCNSNFSTDGNQYRCKKNHHKVPLQQQGLDWCDNNSTILTAVFDGMLWSLTKEKHLNFLLKEKDVTEGRNKKQIEINLQKIAALRTEIAQLDANRAKWLERLFASQITDKEADAYFARFDKENADKTNAITNLENENLALQRQLDSLAELSYNSIIKLAASLQVMTDEKEMYELVHQYIKMVTLNRTTIDGKGCSILTFYFYDGTSETLYYFSKNRKQAIYKRGKIDKRLKYAFTDSEGNSYIPYDADRLERDKDGKITEPEISSIRITDEAANKIMTEELLRQREERNK